MKINTRDQEHTSTHILTHSSAQYNTSAYFCTRCARQSPYSTYTFVAYYFSSIFTTSISAFILNVIYICIFFASCPPITVLNLHVCQRIISFSFTIKYNIYFLQMFHRALGKKNNRTKKRPRPRRRQKEKKKRPLRVLRQQQPPQKPNRHLKLVPL